jgi:hypothetical protein
VWLFRDVKRKTKGEKQRRKTKGEMRLRRAGGAFDFDFAVRLSLFVFRCSLFGFYSLCLAPEEKHSGPFA